MRSKRGFHEELKSEFRDILTKEKEQFKEENKLKIDLHCHDLNSDIPDELYGRILGLPETWVSTEELVNCLNHNNSDIITITNHNNARSCWNLLDKGYDVLPGAEFTCYFPDYKIYIHILCYGFDPEQEEILLELRKNVYTFLLYCRKHEIPTILPHPLYFYKKRGKVPMEIFEKFALLFDRFEVLNGQRDVWQNIVTYEWVSQLNEEKITELSKKHHLDPYDFCMNPFQKSFCGGSDDHMAIFAGSCGTYILSDRISAKKNSKKSEIALNAIRQGHVYPYGHLADIEKLNIALLDYFCQLGMHMEDPGLIRMFLHNGSLKDKLLCLAISNGLQELKRHQYTSLFLKSFHEALHGKRPKWFLNWTVSKNYKPMLEKIDKLAKAKQKGNELFHEEIKSVVPYLYERISHTLAKQIDNHLVNELKKVTDNGINVEEIVRKLEVSSHLRSLLGPSKSNRTEDLTQMNLNEILDHLSFPSLFAIILASSSFVSTKSLYNNRSIMTGLTKEIKKYQHPQRILWLTDTFKDNNGVSSVLKGLLKEIQRYDLPIDILVSDNELESDDHLIVVKSVYEFEIPGYGQHNFKIPDLMQIHQKFIEGAYDRIICSTEVLMGTIALYLKHAFNVPAYFYMHTDWLDYFSKSTNLNSHELDRIRRLLRTLYKSFDGIFVLNNDHKKWLKSHSMGINSDKIMMTAHWIEEKFQKKRLHKSQISHELTNHDQILLYVGRISREKGVLELPQLYHNLKMYQENVKMVIAGSGPEEKELREKIPDAIFTGWIDQEKLIDLYSISDLLVLPSKFDTFGCVVLEAMACSLPVIAYNTKGPKDIINNGKNGFLVNDFVELAEKTIIYFQNHSLQNRMKQKAVLRSKDFLAVDIINELLRNINLEEKLDPSKLEEMILTTETETW